MLPRDQNCLSNRQPTSSSRRRAELLVALLAISGLTSGCRSSQPVAALKPPHDFSAPQPSPALAAVALPVDRQTAAPTDVQPAAFQDDPQVAIDAAAANLAQDQPPKVSAADPLVIDPSTAEESEDLPLPKPDADGEKAEEQDQDETENAGAGRQTENDNDEQQATARLLLEDVISSVRVTFPAVQQAAARRAEFAANITTALGEFDDVLEGHSINQPLSFYENYRHGLSVKRPLWYGGYASAGYRLGDGNFEPWYGERETDEGGEFKLGVDLPLLQGRAIDKRRAALRAAQLESGRTEPEFLFELLNAQGAAAIAYWEWVAAGQQVRIQQRLLDLAILRARQFGIREREGDIAEFLKIDNDRIVASRRIKLVETQRKFGETAVKLSLYLRDLTGQPQLPAADLLPGEFEQLETFPDRFSNALITSALSSRPEIRILEFDASVLRVELAQANNQFLPELNVILEAAQDIGGQTSSKGDKSPAEIEAGVYGSVPLQRRMARGKIDSLQAKLAQVDAKLRLTRDKIATEIQQLIVAREAAISQIEQAEENLRLTEQSLRFAVIALDNGDITLPVFNIYEQAVADAESVLVVALAEYYIAESLLQIAIGQEIAPDF